MPKKIQKASKSNKKPSLTHDHFFKLFYSEPRLAQELFQLIFPLSTLAVISSFN